MTVFRLGPSAPADAIRAALRRRSVLPGEFYGRLRREARTTAFTVSRIAQLDQIDHVKRLLIDDLKAGGDFALWKDRMLANPGTASLQPWHLETIYRTNVAVYYAQGRARSILEHSVTHPYLMYSAVLDTRVRPNHARLHGIILPVEHPFWKKHFPPLGFNCRCQVVSLTKAQAERRIGEARSNGRDVTKPPPGDWSDHGWDYDRLNGTPLNGMRRSIRSRASELSDESVVRVLHSGDAFDEAMHIAVSREASWAIDRIVERQGLAGAVIGRDGATLHRMIGRQTFMELSEAQRIDAQGSTLLIARTNSNAPTLSQILYAIRLNVGSMIFVRSDGSMMVIRPLHFAKASEVRSKYIEAERAAKAVIDASLRAGSVTKAAARDWFNHIVLIMLAAERLIEYETVGLSIPDSIATSIARLIEDRL